MKNQYFGDLNDYRKYGLLRCLSEAGLSLGVCWMLTPDNRRSDGQKTQYLDLPGRWRPYDPPLFGLLAGSVLRDEVREVAQLEASELLPNTRFFTPFLPDAAPERDRYFEDAGEALGDRDLLFFDPDMGLEVPSVLRGVKASSRYLYWQELEAAWQRGQSLLVYQHFPRQAHEQFAGRLAAEVQSRTSGSRVLALTTPTVVFLLAAQSAHAARLEAALDFLKQRWQGQISVVELPTLVPEVEPQLVFAPATPAVAAASPVVAAEATFTPAVPSPGPAFTPMSPVPPAPPAFADSLPNAPIGPSSNDHYATVIAWSDAIGCYVAAAPDLEGCAATGQTPQTALAALGQAKSAWLRAAREAGRPIPPASARPENRRTSL